MKAYLNPEMEMLVCNDGDIIRTSLIYLPGEVDMNGGNHIGLEDLLHS